MFPCSRGQVCGRQPGDGGAGALQHLRLLRPVHAHHRILLQDRCQQLQVLNCSNNKYFLVKPVNIFQRCEDCVRRPVHGAAGDRLPRLPDALLRLHPQGDPGGCHHDRGHFQRGASRHKAHVVQQKYADIFIIHFKKYFHLTLPPCAEIDLLPGFVCFFVGLLYELEMGIFTGVSTTSLYIYISIHIYIYIR